MTFTYNYAILYIEFQVVNQRTTPNNKQNITISLNLHL